MYFLTLSPPKYTNTLSAISTFDQDTDVLNIPTVMGDTVILPTSLSFQNAGYCNVTPNYTDARLQYREGTDNQADTATTIFLCNTMDMCDFSNGSLYDFSSLGNVTLLPTLVRQGRYTMGIVQSCTTTVLSMTYSIIFTNTGKSNVQCLAMLHKHTHTHTHTHTLPHTHIHTHKHTHTHTHNCLLSLSLSAVVTSIGTCRVALHKLHCYAHFLSFQQV